MLNEGRETVTEQSLDDEPAERMSDHDRLGLEFANDRSVVLHHVVDAVTRHLFRVLSRLLDRGRVVPTNRSRSASSPAW